MSELAISVEHISKMYKLYRGRADRLKDALHLSGKKSYQEYYALSDVSFEVKKGETVGLIGTNGAGKSTLLKLITGVLTPSAGQIEVNGKISALLELGAGFNYEYTGMENIYFNGTLMGYTKEQMEEKVPKIVEFAGIGEYINQPVKTYSSGMFARLAFAMAINVEPDILIVDEALSVGDIYFQSKCFKKMDEIKRNGTTVLLVTHDMSSVVKYCDKVVVLNHGKVVKEGNPKEMVDIYKKILVNQYDENEEETDKKLSVKEGSWMSQMSVNEENVLYGSGKAHITDFGLFDEKDQLTGMILKKNTFRIKIKVEFLEDIEYPIFAFTIKNARGAEVTGTNSMFEKVDFPLAKKGETYVVTFTQKAMLQGGDYLMSFGCTGYENGEFTVYDRLYDVMNLTIVSEQDTVGSFDIDSKVTVEKI
ncbi:MAG: ABC transporter ATP-binding protein [Thermoflexaceae bacterium]|nr:ABC transporter ATP-binding protein [Thermoflexaceae bacterium]